MSQSELLGQIEAKFSAIGQDPAVHLEGLLHAATITYWDYILPDALLNLQVQRTQHPDELVFIMYHQINELLFKMTLWEMDQVSASDQPEPAFFAEKLRRISRYFDMLSSSFTIMGEGMEKEQYLKFRTTLTPASGFQSAQYRRIEFASTDCHNLVDQRFRSQLGPETNAEELYEHLYWQAAGKDHKGGEKNTLLREFERRYKAEFLRDIDQRRTGNLYAKFLALPAATRQDKDLVAAMRHYDYTVNITWVMAHYRAALQYLGKGRATGGSDWHKYMLPMYQRRIFFPSLWSEEELRDWGVKESNEALGC